MITIPTAELVDTLSDVIPMADPDVDLPEVNCVRLEWDGDQLHALATDRWVIGWSTWSPHDGEGSTSWGGVDSPWAATIPLEAAKYLVKVFKLPKAGAWTPLALEHINPGALRVQRHRDTGHSAVVAVVRDVFEAFPDVRAELSKHDVIEPVAAVGVPAHDLARFAKVRPHGGMVLRFARELVHVGIGGRFVGSVIPSGSAVRLAAAPKVDGGGSVLRDGAGVLVSEPGGGGDGD